MDPWRPENPPTSTDQQGCFFFYLYLAADGSCPVVGSVDLFTAEEEEEEDLDLTAREFAASASWLAPDFEQFIYRYWVENVIWFHLINNERPVADLPLPAQEYVKLLQTPDRPVLDARPAPLRWSSDNPNQLDLW